MKNAELAWQNYHQELEQVSYADHINDPAKDTDDRPIITVRQMHMIFIFAWEKALFECQTQGSPSSPSSQV